MSVIYTFNRIKKESQAHHSAGKSREAPPHRPSYVVIVDRICNETRRNFLKFPSNRTINPLSSQASVLLRSSFVHSLSVSVRLLARVIA